MKVYRKSASSRTRATFARPLAFVLLIGIVYSVVFGSAHNHKFVSSNVDTNISASSAAEASASSPVPLKSNSNGDECLICLFHQQLFNSIVHGPVFVVKPSAEVVFASTPAVYYHSNPISSSPIARLSGRAPPVA